MASYLVTGGAGFIGSHQAEELVRRGQTVRVADNLATGHRHNLAHLSGVEFVEGDLADMAFATRAVAGMDYVLHQAAIPSVQRSVKDPVTTNAVNVAGTLNLLTAARDAAVKRFVFASSSSLYGESPTLPKIETMPPAPISPYGLQKLAGETYCGLFHRLYGTPTVALRYFNVFGPRQDPGSEYSAVIPRFITALRDGGRPTVFGDGEQTRDFTFVANVVQANRKACTAPPEALGLAYNVACEERISLNGLLGVLGELMGKKADPLHAPARSGDIRHSLADIARARTLLGYAPEITLREGLRRTVESL